MDKIKSFIDKEFNRDRLIKTTLKVLSTPSPQTDKFEEEPLVKDFIKDVISPYVSEYLPVEIDEKGNLIASIGALDTKGIMLVGYAMTPQAGTMKDAYVGQITPGEKYGYDIECFRGRGSCEQKGSLSAMLEALSIVAKYKEKLKGSFVFVCSTAGETGRHDSLQYIMDKSNFSVDTAIIGLGTNNEVCLGNKGRIDVIIEVWGKPCHSSTPDKGINAIEGAAEVMNTLKKVIPNATHPFLGKSTFAPMYIESFPRATHTIQERCVISYDRRLMPSESPEEVMQQIKDAVKEIKGYRIEVKRGPFMYPSEVAADSRTALLLDKAFQSISGNHPTHTYFNSSLDAGLLNRKNIETLMFGPGNVEFAHTSEEVVPVEQVALAAKVYAYAVLDYLSGD